MCGVAGFLSNSSAYSGNALSAIASDMSDRIIHRGPDHGGVWLDEQNQVALAHRRLSILDTSSDGHQPMVSRSGRYVICYNGEVYNFKDLRKELAADGIPFQSQSDTEVILAAIEQYGFESALQRMVGMFALALWDVSEKALFLARDRLGEKPMYYGTQGKSLLFGSELKSFAGHPHFVGEINRSAIALLMRHNCIPSPHSIYTGIKKLPPGTFIRIPASQCAAATDVVPTQYWNRAVDTDRNGSLVGAPRADVVQSVSEALTEAIRGQMISDVPIGAFLSGGVDSSLVVALMQRISSSPINTFTMGFESAEFDESGHAAAVAQHLGTNHTAMTVTAEDALNVVPMLPTMYCEPFSDSSQIPTFLVSKIAAQSVTVALSGDGADEIFGGYNRHINANRTEQIIERYPSWLRAAIATSLTALSAKRWDQIAQITRPILPDKLKVPNLGDKVFKAAAMLHARSVADSYDRWTSHWRDPNEILASQSVGAAPAFDYPMRKSDESAAEWMMRADSVTYLPDDILVKVDRAAMANSLETRAPFLDHRVVELGMSLPGSVNIFHGSGKQVLREILYAHVPKRLIERPKTGFAVPLDSWLRGPLKEWAGDLLNGSRLRDEGYFNQQTVERFWNAHQSGQRNYQYQLWDVLMFQAWMEAQQKHSSKV